MRRAHRTDGSHAEIVEHLTAIGCTIQSLAGIGGGCPDLLVGYEGRNLLVEEKDGEKAESQRDLTEHQKRWVKNWRGMPVIVATSGREAVRLVVEAVVKESLTTGANDRLQRPGAAGENDGH